MHNTENHILNQQGQPALVASFFIIESVIRFIDMFSGIGGFREGLTRAGGFACVGHKAVGMSCLTTFFIESAQFILKTGVVDIDDFIVNTLGSLMGIMAYATKAAETVMGKHCTLPREWMPSS